MVRDCLSAFSDRRMSDAYAVNQLVRELSSALLFFLATKYGLPFHVATLVLIGIVAAATFIRADVEYRQGRYHWPLDEKEPLLLSATASRRTSTMNSGGARSVYSYC